MDLAEGDVLEDMQDLGGGWSQGRNARTGRSARFHRVRSSRGGGETTVESGRSLRPQQVGEDLTRFAGSLETHQRPRHSWRFRPLPADAGQRMGHKMGFNAKLLRSGMVPQHIVHRAALILNQDKHPDQKEEGDARGVSTAPSDAVGASAAGTTQEKVIMAQSLTRRLSVKEKIAKFEDMKDSGEKRQRSPGKDRGERGTRKEGTETFDGQHGARSSDSPTPTTMKTAIPSAEHAPYGTLKRSIRLDRLLRIDEAWRQHSICILPMEGGRVGLAGEVASTLLSFQSASAHDHEGWVDAVVSNVWQAEVLSDRGHIAAARIQMWYRATVRSEEEVCSPCGIENAQ